MFRQPYRWFTQTTGPATLPDVKFGPEVRRRRKALGLTIEDLAAASRLTPNYIGTVEKGTRDPSLSTVLALAKGLRVTPGELLGSIKELSPAAIEAGKLFENVPRDVQDAVLVMLRATATRRR